MKLTKAQRALLESTMPRGIAWVYPVGPTHETCVELGCITLARYGPLTGYVAITPAGREALRS